MTFKQLLTSAATAIALIASPAMADKGGGTSDGDCSSCGGDTPSNGGSDNDRDVNECGVERIVHDGMTVLAVTSSQYNEGSDRTLFVIEPRLGDTVSGKALQSSAPIDLSSLRKSTEEDLVSTVRGEANRKGINIKDDFTLAECGLSQSIDYLKESIQNYDSFVVRPLRSGKHAESHLTQ